MASVTPMMQQYLDTKAEYKDCFLSSASVTFM